MASNPVSPTPSSTTPITADRVGQIVGTVTAIAAEIEQVMAASGAVGAQTMPQVEQLTALFGNLAGVAIQAAHEVAGQAVTPDSVLALMPVATALVNPPSGA